MAFNMIRSKMHMMKHKYAFAALAARKKPIPLIVLFAMHLVEALTIGRKVAKEKGVGAAEWIANCLAFGFTWWLPLRSE